jgi:hypothetical protein
MHLLPDCLSKAVFQGRLRKWPLHTIARCHHIRAQIIFENSSDLISGSGKLLFRRHWHPPQMRTSTPRAHVGLQVSGRRLFCNWKKLSLSCWGSRSTAARASSVAQDLRNDQHAATFTDDWFDVLRCSASVQDLGFNGFWLWLGIAHEQLVCRTRHQTLDRFLLITRPWIQHPVLFLLRL